MMEIEQLEGLNGRINIIKIDKHLFIGDKENIEDWC